MSQKIIILTNNTGIPTTDGLEELNNLMNNDSVVLKTTTLEGYKILINKKHILYIDKRIEKKGE